MDFLEFAQDMENKTIESYRTLAEKCQSNEGVKNILIMLAADHKKHAKALEKLRIETAVEMEETEVFREARELFAGMQGDKIPFSCEIDQVKLYEDARDLILKKLQFYSDIVEKMETEENRVLVRKLAEEEKKQAVVLGNIIEMVRRPQSWLEDAEFHHLDDY
jgi:rubrerythrin